MYISFIFYIWNFYYQFDDGFFIWFQNALFCASSDGLKVTVEDMKSIQLTAFMEPEIFQVCFSR